MSNNEFPSRGEIYFADLEPVKGSEQNGQRPVLIVSNNIMNKNAPIVIAIPLSRTGEKVNSSPFATQFNYKKDVRLENENIKKLNEMGHKFAPVSGFIFTHHARAITKDRLIGEKVGEVTNKLILQQVNNAIKDAFALEACDDCGIPLRDKGLMCGKCKKIHRNKCFVCYNVFPFTYNNCPNCGKEVRK